MKNKIKKIIVVGIAILLLITFIIIYTVVFPYKITPVERNKGGIGNETSITSTVSTKTTKVSKKVLKTRIKKG